MHPALSVILLTTLIGVGQGLFLALYTGQVYSLIQLIPMQESQRFYANGAAVSLAFLIAGLIASFFHLGRPERAWRSATRWRTSWLSREVIVLPIMMALVFTYAVIHYFGWTQPLFTLPGDMPIDASLIVGALGTLAAFALFLSTVMIYASIRFLQEWASPLTVINYTLLGGASGFTLAAAFSAYLGLDLVGFFGWWAVVLTLAAAVTRISSLIRNRRLKHKSNLQTAIGVRHNRIQQKAQGAMGGSFNTREFFHHRGPGAMAFMRLAFLILVFPVPIALLASAWFSHSEYLALAAFAVQYIGLLAERWYFFADAQHPQNLYYQTVS